MKKVQTKEEKIQELQEKALKILGKKKDIYFFGDLAIELGYNRQYLYDIGFSPDKNDTLKTALEENKKTVKRGLRNKWFNNNNPTVQIALYRLIADEEELNRLNNSKIELTGANGTPLTPPVINILPVKPGKK